MPYFVEMASSLSSGGKPPSGVTAERSTKKPENTPGVVAMRSRASDVVKFWYAWTDAATTARLQKCSESIQQIRTSRSDGRHIRTSGSNLVARR